MYLRRMCRPCLFAGENDLRRVDIYAFQTSCLPAGENELQRVEIYALCKPYYLRLCHVCNNSSSRSGLSPARGWSTRDDGSAAPVRVASHASVSRTIVARSRKVSLAAIAFAQLTSAKPSISGSDCGIQSGSSLQGVTSFSARNSS